jgi:WD40 repeat protein
MEPSALNSIRKEFYAREDQISLETFIFIVQKHLLAGGRNHAGASSKEKRAFAANMYELFKDVDVNGDGDMEWEELTKFIVEKANMLNNRLKLTGIAKYYDSCHKLDSSALVRQRNEFSALRPIEGLNQFVSVEDHSHLLHVYNQRTGALIKTFATDSVNIGLAHVPDHNLLAVSGSDSSLSTFLVDDPVPSKRYSPVASWSTPGVQMCVDWMKSNQVLYSGGSDGKINAWKLQSKENIATMDGHTNIVMNLLCLSSIDNLVSASLDSTVCLWDTYTHTRTMKLEGHRKGVFSTSFNQDYRLLVSSGFDHDACVWSPFASSLVYRLKGHHASLIGCQCIENSPEIITADAEGIFKLWDIRTFNCVQSFVSDQSNLRSSKQSAALNCFFHSSLPKIHKHQTEDDARIYAASKMIISFDQEVVVHEETTDFTAVRFVFWGAEKSVFITVSLRNLTIWDGLLGCRTTTHPDICGNEITACCMDDRFRKILIGDTTGHISVFNPLNGGLMKSCPEDIDATVVSINYVVAGNTRRFVAGYGNGVIRIYDESALDDCATLRQFDQYHSHPEQLSVHYCGLDDTVAAASSSAELVRLWSYSSGKCEVELATCDDTEHIMSVTYLKPRPNQSGPKNSFLMTADSNGNVLLWGSRGSRFAGQRICGFTNNPPVTAEVEQGEKFHHRDEDGPPLRTLPLDSTNFPKEFEHLAELDPVGDSDQLLPGQDEVGEGGECIENVMTAPPNTGTSVTSSQRGSPSGPNTARSLESTQSGKGITVDHRLVAQRQKRQKRAIARAASEKDESEQKYGRVQAALCMGFDEKRCRIFTGNEVGQVMSFDLAQAFAQIDRLHSQMETLDDDELEGGNALSERRTPQTALAPVYKSHHKYILSPHERHCNLGVDFMWSVPAHHAQMLSVQATPHGLVTSGDDRLVKLWSWEGQVIGVLLQSVALGERSPQWHMDLDVEEIMKEEDAELDEILEEVAKLEKDKSQPNIYQLDFSGLQPGNKSAAFSRSELRQRIELTSKKLALNFHPLEEEVVHKEDSVVSPSKRNGEINPKTPPQSILDLEDEMEKERRLKHMTFRKANREHDRERMIEQAIHSTNERAGLDDTKETKYQYDGGSGVKVTHRLNTKVEEIKQEMISDTVDHLYEELQAMENTVDNEFDRYIDSIDHRVHASMQKLELLETDGIQSSFKQNTTTTMKRLTALNPLKTSDRHEVMRRSSVSVPSGAKLEMAMKGLTLHMAVASAPSESDDETPLPSPLATAAHNVIGDFGGSGVRARKMSIVATNIMSTSKPKLGSERKKSTALI